MKKINVLIMTMLTAVLFSNCSKDNDEPIDTDYPVIDITAQVAFPKQCSIIKRGEKFTFNASLSDNVQLGSVSVDIHHNFDQHSHSTEVNDCDLDPVKTAIKPFLFIQDYPIPAGQKTFQATAEITVPADIDPGDYHFLIRLTDKEGWQTIKGLSIKII